MPIIRIDDCYDCNDLYCKQYTNGEAYGESFGYKMLEFFCGKEERPLGLRKWNDKRPLFPEWCPRKVKK